MENKIRARIGRLKSCKISFARCGLPIYFSSYPGFPKVTLGLKQSPDAGSKKLIFNCSFVIFLIFSLFFTSVNASSESTASDRIHAHLLINDARSAAAEAVSALRLHPQSKLLWEAYVESLAKSGDEREMYLAWNHYLTLFPDEKENRFLLENMAWGVIEEGARSTSPLIRIYSILGAFYGNDNRGVNLLHHHFKDNSSLIRGAVVQLSSGLKDHKLKEEVKRLLNEEKDWKVKIEAIRASGKMKIVESKQELIGIIGNFRSSAEEKAAAIEALVYLIETPDRTEISHLASSDRAGLRILACQVLAHAELQEHLDLIYPLLTDHNADVRIAALNTLTLLHDSNSDLIYPLLNDGNPHVSITAAWALTLNDPEEGQRHFEPWLRHKKKSIRRFAASALSSTGKHGFPLITETFNQADDPYVRMNLAFGMIGQRVNHQAACQELCHCCINMNERWMWEENASFRTLSPSMVKYQGMIPNYPEVVNQLTHLEILNILAIMEEPSAQNAVKHFLEKKSWGVTGMASALLLTEGDESSIKLVQNLLKDSDQVVRVQAAVVLALWGEGESALSVLQDAYPTADRETKERILESVGRVGSPSSLSFLAEKLNEPHQTLRIIAASSLIQTLYQ